MCYGRFLRSSKTTLPRLIVTESATIGGDLYFVGSISIIAGSGIAFDGRTISNTNISGTVAGVIAIDNESGSLKIITNNGLGYEHAGGTLYISNIATVSPGPGILINNGTLVNDGTLVSGPNTEIDQGTVGVIQSPTFNNVTTSGHVWQQGRNRQYYQNLNYATTTSSSPVDIGSVVITPEFSGHIVIDVAMRTNNETNNAGVNTYLYVNDSTLITEVYYTHMPLTTNEAALPFHYELTGQSTITPLVIGMKHSTAGIGGTVISRIFGLIAEEI